MYNFLKLGMLILALVFFSGCVADRGDRRLVKPLEKMLPPYDNGTIYQAGFNERPLYEEKRARNVGDGLTMTIAAIPPAKKPEKKEGEEEDSRRDRRKERDEELSNIASDALVGNLSMIVMEVLGNGHLFVAGGKQVTVDDEDKYVRITGVVDPNNLTGGNMVSSTLVSDVRIQVDDLRIFSDGTATSYSEGQSTFGNNFQSMSR
ncbi:MAG: hypothetical protein B7Y56_01065 [Gallionellales bacterium 35-53-114]|jgi:flagellar L-ring protein precursor FlgH|nr:MAG: hypothetical protein B7Y56_01065 [Gallionellales bacterium 35-53-114]OYZ64226.1 MAG: hypothetical protein B7Y04_04850 [Gallionellales bacterium 24-53-125]OZB10464.1 MAG: hypothetical protein B7X61_02855 [Gallionellales bacterium 39-52-133]HQS57082.1 flagellar basal body L-ring protein FlgH [Gallionellaceae bacterium]HQS74730.1 flagellar basal body L-ring protein FlgH [Gallionellaceae bacterium]